MARHVLDDVTRTRLRQMDGMGDGPFLFQGRPRQVMVRVSRRIEEGAQLQRFIESCYALVGRVQGEASAPGMEIETVSPGAEAVCQVCGTAVEAARRVVCRKCRVPHHDDCWAYNDGCSIFACGERRSERG